MIKTKEWAESNDIDTQDILPPIKDYNEQYKRNGADIARRTIIIHSVAAVGYGLRREPVCQWLKEQNLWDYASPKEVEFLLSQKHAKFMEEARLWTQWLQEAQWALLWTIKKVGILGMPVRTCDTLYMVNEVMPLPGTDVEPFVTSAVLRNASEIRAEEQRIEKLFFLAQKASQNNEMPEDLIYGVLFQRYHAFEWLSSLNEWDDIDVESKEPQDSKD
jgi:hypothetical protein